MNKKIFMAIILAIFSHNVSSSNKLIELGFTAYTSQLYPKLADTYALNSIDYEKYLTIATTEIERYPDNAYMYYIKGYILLGYHGFAFRQSAEGNMSRETYFSTEKSRLMVLETQSYLVKSLSVHNAASVENKLSKDTLSSIYTKLKSPFQKEKSIKARILMTSLDDLEGCPSDIPKSDPYYECSPIANSWTEYLYREYADMFSLYGSLLDKENMERIKQEFDKRVKNNEKGIKLTEKSAKNDAYYLDKFTKDEQDFWHKYNSGELEGKVIDIKDIPDAYKDIPFYWKNYIAAKGVAEYAQWDIRGVDSPDSDKAKQHKTAQTKPQTPAVQPKPVQPTRSATSKTEPVAEEADSRLWYLALGVLILLVVGAVLVRGRRQKP